MEKKLAYTLSGNCRNGIYFDTFWFKFFAKSVYRILLTVVKNTVHFIGCNYLRTLCNFRIVFLQFFGNLINIINRISSLCGSCIHNVHQNSGTLNMAKELMTKTDSFRSTFDQSRNICDDKTAILSIYNAKVRT